MKPFFSSAQRELIKICTDNSFHSLPVPPSFCFVFVASVSQKRQKESQPGGASKKHKPNRKSLGVPPKKNRKTGVDRIADAVIFQMPGVILSRVPRFC